MKSNLPNACHVRWLRTIGLFILAVIVYVLGGGMAWHGGDNPITPAERKANEELLRDIAAIAPEQPAKSRRGLDRLQWFLLASTAGLLIALVVILAAGVLS